MSHSENLIGRVREIAARVIAPAASDYDHSGGWPESSVKEYFKCGEAL